MPKQEPFPNVGGALAASLLRQIKQALCLLRNEPIFIAARTYVRC